MQFISLGVLFFTSAIDNLTDLNGLSSNVKHSFPKKYKHTASLGKSIFKYTAWQVETSLHY